MTYSEQAATVIDRDAAAGTIVVVVEPDIRDGTAVIGQLVAWRGPRVLVGGEGGPATRRYWVQEPKTAPPEGGHILAAIGPAGKPPLVLVWAREPA